MGYTNKTTHYELPQYVATDKPKYLTDFNETMQAIDTQMYTNAEAAATADNKAVAAKDIADGAVESIGTLNAQINGDPSDPSDTGLNGQVTDNKSDIETMQALIGNGTPTTSNQTIIGAINGLEGAVAPREDGADLANNYATGAQFARGGSVFTALTDLTAGTPFASLTLNTDYKNSETIVEQISAFEGQLSTLGEEISEVSGSVEFAMFRFANQSFNAGSDSLTLSLSQDMLDYIQARSTKQILILSSMVFGSHNIECYTTRDVISQDVTSLTLEYLNNESTSETGEVRVHVLSLPLDNYVALT